ncbi:MAG: Maf family protein [Candidatus Kapaibacterium sp.]
MLNLTQILDLKNEIVLASGSPRRKMLLEQIGLQFEVIPADIDEDDIVESDPTKFVMELANRKAKHVSSFKTHKIIIGSDTTVYLNEELLNKPAEEKDAYEMLTRLSGNTHQVYTGVSLVHHDSNSSTSFYVKTDVTFRELGEREKYAYIATGSPMDKAGSYGIQDDFGSVFVEKIVGCYYNIVGFPLSRFYQEIKDFNDKL